MSPTNLYILNFSAFNKPVRACFNFSKRAFKKIRDFLNSFGFNGLAKKIHHFDC